MNSKNARNEALGTDEKFIKILFWISLAWTLLQMTFLTLFTLNNGKEIPEMVTWTWLTIVTIYAGKKRVERWGDGVKDTRKGEICVYVVWLVTAFIYSWYMFHPSEVKLSDQLFTTFTGVSTIFFGSEISKSIDFKLQKRKGTGASTRTKPTG